MKRNLSTSILILTTAIALTGCGGKSSSKSEPAPAETAPVAEPAPAVAPAPAAEPAAATQPTGSSATAGQKLIDLNRAREAGAISDEEYEAAKKRILDSQ